MLRKICLTVMLGLALTAVAVNASASPVYVYAYLSGDPRPAEPDNIFVDVTISWDTATSPNDALWTVDVNSPAHPSAKLGAFGFNLVGLGTDYTFSAFSPAAWSISGPSFVPGTGNMNFMFVANDPALPGNDVTNAVDLTFKMTKIGGTLSEADFMGAPASCSNDAWLGCHQLAAHVQSLVPGTAGLDSGAAIGDFTFDSPIPPVPEPASLLLFSTGLVGLRACRKRR